MVAHRYSYTFYQWSLNDKSCSYRSRALSPAPDPIIRGGKPEPNGAAASIKGGRFDRDNDSLWSTLVRNKDVFNKVYVVGQGRGSSWVATDHY